MSQQAQKIALPAFLRKRLQAFRIGEGTEQSYLIKDERKGLSYRFEPWQYFILEVLPGCEDFPKLSSVFEDRFGHSITSEEVEKLFGMVADYKLFGLSATSHPMLDSFNKKRLNSPSESSQTVPDQENVSGEQKSESKDTPVVDKDTLPAGIRNVVGFDESVKKGWKLFNPSKLIKLIYPVFVLFKPIIYLLPALLIAALFTTFKYAAPIEQDLTRLVSSVSFIEHILFSMVTVNLSVIMMTALVAYSYRASVTAFCIIFYLGFFPRFMVRIGHVQQLSRRERIWLHAAPLLLRLGFFSTGILLWFNTRATTEFLSLFGLAVAAISTISFFITVNPLIKNSGYHLLSAFLNEPYLKGKSYKALLNKLKGNVYKESDNNILIAYALASAVFMVIFIAVVLLIVGHILKMQLGGAGILLTMIIGFFLIQRLVSKFRKIGQAYERSQQFERWRKRTLPGDEEQTVQKKQKVSFYTYLKTASLLLFFALLFVPYHFEPGGRFVILPDQQQEITAGVSGIIDEIYFDGGEVLAKGTIIGRLNYSEFSSQEKIYDARILEQQAVIDELKSRPRPEEVRLAESSLEVEKTRTEFSKAKFIRLEKLYKEGATSFEELDEARKEYQIDVDRVEEKRANLELIKLGAPPDQIAAAKAKLLGWEEQRNYYRDQIEQSILYMPFNGKLVTLHLKQKIGSYLNKGEALIVVENTQQVLAQIDVPEPDIGYIKKQAKTTVRLVTYQDMIFNGVVSTIDTNVQEERFGKVVRVITVLDNQADLLKSGMTGYAKIESQTLPVWKVFSLAFVRFVRVEAWSWIP